MNRRLDEFGEMLDVIAYATRFNKTYQGQILDNQDELKRGRCRISIPDLGWFKEVESPWVEPEYLGRGAIVPDVEETVAVYFMNGDAARPIYRSKTGEIKDTVPPSFTGPGTKILYEDDDITIMYDGETITVDAKEKKVCVKNAQETVYTLLGDLIDAVSNLTTYGSPVSHTVTAASQADLSALKTRFQALFKE
jgi:hypothetical protein